MCNSRTTWEGAVDVSANAIVNSDASYLLYRPAEATHVYTTRPADFFCTRQVHAMSYTLVCGQQQLIKQKQSSDW